MSLHCSGGTEPGCSDGVFPCTDTTLKVNTGYINAPMLKCLIAQRISEIMDNMPYIGGKLEGSKKGYGRGLFAHRSLERNLIKFFSLARSICNI